jgi:hypothetical protein
MSTALLRAAVQPAQKGKLLDLKQKLERAK